MLPMSLDCPLLIAPSVFFSKGKVHFLIILFDVNTAICLVGPHGATLVILDSLGCYCDVKSLNCVVKIKLSGICSIFEQVILV